MQKKSILYNLVMGFQCLFESPSVSKKLLHRSSQSDEEAIRSDWEMVGNDLRFAFKKFTAENLADSAANFENYYGKD